MNDRDLTNLESVALAHVQHTGPCTAHELRQAFAGSSAGRYSGSAGAIYPLARRLVEMGYLKSEAGRNGAQRKRLLSITPKGRAAIRDWMFSMNSPDIFPDDPLRTRFQYFRELSAEDQGAWIDAAIAAIEAQTGIVKQEYAGEALNTPIDRHILSGILESNRQRLRWLRKARDLAGKHPVAETARAT